MGKISTKMFVNRLILKQGIVTLLFCFSFLTGCSQHAKEEQVNYFEIVRPLFTGELAYSTTAYVADYWRVAGNTGFNNTILLIADSLKASGYVLESEAAATDRLSYRIEKRPMTHKTWEPVSASLQIVGDTKPLLVSESNRNMTYLNSASTPSEGLQAEVVWIKSAEELKSKTVKDKVIYTENNVRRLYEMAIKKGALGIISYDNPTYLQPEKNTTSIQFRSLPANDSVDFWGIAMSFEARKELTRRMRNGKTQVLVNIQTKQYSSEELTIVATIKGSQKPKEQLVFSAHIQEPGANDNASGVGTQLEMARVAAKLLNTGAIDVERSLTFLWGDEIVSTRRYITEDPLRAKDIKWGISLDMVGENTAVTGGTFLIEKMPDPSAIWTRGNDKHTEWGGEVLSLEDMKPHYLNDFILSNFKEQSKFANWPVDTNPFEGGSDHTPFLNADIPGLLLWHFTDQFYHTDNDRIDKVSQETLKNVGTTALVSGLELLNADKDFAKKNIRLLKHQAFERLTTETQLSKEAIASGSTLAQEMEIIEAWGDWYERALGNLKDIVDPGDIKTQKMISEAKEEIAVQTQKHIQHLKR